MEQQVDVFYLDFRLSSLEADILNSSERSRTRDILRSHRRVSWYLIQILVGRIYLPIFPSGPNTPPSQSVTNPPPSRLGLFDRWEMQTKAMGLSGRVIMSELSYSPIPTSHTWRRESESMQIPDIAVLRSLGGEGEWGHPVIHFSREIEQHYCRWEG